MAFVNLPANLQDIFGSITDRIAKLETGPNQALYTAESAQGSASSAAAEAANAQTQAVQALAAATIASSQATQAQTSADGKNSIYYSTSAPGSTANKAGDIWYQYGTTAPYVNRVIAQWSGAGGTSWTSTGLSGLVLSTLDAGSITTGTLSAIEISAGTGGTQFHVSPAGYMSAQGVYIQGTITADTGIFRGSLYSAQGTIGGWTLGTDKLSSGTSEMSSATGNAIFNKVTGFGEIYGYANLYISTTGYFGGLLETAGSATFGSGATYPFKYFSSTGVLQSPGTYQNTVSTRAVYVASSGNMGTVASTIRKKHEIESFAIDQEALLNLDVKKFKYLPEIDPEQTQQYGFIAEQAEELGLLPLILYDAEDRVDYFAYEKLPIFLLQVIKNQEERIKALENK